MRGAEKTSCLWNKTNLQPLFDIVEGLLVGHVVHHDDTVSPPVVAGGDGAEPLLTSCVPNLEGGIEEKYKNSNLYLKFDRLPIKFYRPNLKIYTDCGNIGLGICIVSKSIKQRIILFLEINS